MKNLFLFTLSIVFHYGFSQVANEEYMKTSVVQLNQTVSDFSFYKSDGKTANLSDYKGKVILINFFATWCGPCMQEMPYIENDLWSKLKNNPNFIILSFGRQHSQKEINEFIGKKKFTFPIYADENESVYKHFATKYIPRNYLIDENGKIVYASTGFYREEFNVLKEKINSLLKL